MFLSAIVKAHSDGLAQHADLANLAVDHDEAAEQAATVPAGDAVDALAAREKRLIELPAIHRARWL